MSTLDWVEDVRRDLLCNLINRRRHPMGEGVDFAKCGTASNYRQHIRYGEKPCRPCRQAEYRRNEDRYKRDPERRRANRRAYYARHKEEINRKRREWKARRSASDKVEPLNKMIQEVNDELRGRQWRESQRKLRA